MTFTATVSATEATPTGSVTFTDTTTGKTLATETLNSTGSAQYSTSALAQESHHIEATYSPSYAEFAASSTKLTQKVNLVSTTVGMTSSPSSPSLVGQAVTFTVTLTAENGQTPTGTVTFYDGKTQLGTGPVTLSGGVAQYSTGSGTDGLSEGTHKIKAVYSGTAGDFATSSVTLTQKVVQ